MLLLACAFSGIYAFAPTKNKPILRTISDNTEKYSRPFSCLGCHRVEHRLANLQEYIEKMSSAMLYCDDLAFVENRMYQKQHMQFISNATRNITRNFTKNNTASTSTCPLLRPLHFLRNEICRLSTAYGISLSSPTFYFDSSDFIL